MRDKQAVVLLGYHHEQLLTEVDNQQGQWRGSFLKLLIAHISRYGIHRFLLVTHAHSEALQQFVAEHLQQEGMQMEVFVEPSPMGTAGSLSPLADRLDEQFLFFYGNALFDIDLLEFVSSTGRFPDAEVVMTLREIEDMTDQFEVKSSITGKVVACHPSTHHGWGWGHGTVFWLSRNIVSLIKKASCSLIEDIVPQLIEQQKVYAFKAEGTFISQKNDPESWIQSIAKPALLLDRDCILRVDPHDIHSSEDWFWVPGAIEAIKYANNMGYYVAILSQTEDEADILRFIQEQLFAIGAHVDHFMTSLSLDTDQHIRSLSQQYPLLLSDSVLVSKQQDLAKCAAREGMWFLHFTQGNVFQHLKKQLGED